MHDCNRQLLRAAQAIRDQLATLHQRRFALTAEATATLMTALENVQTARRRLTLCCRHGWLAAAARLYGQLDMTLRNLPYHLSQLERTVQTSRLQLPSLRQVVAELDQLQRECGPVEYRPGERLLAATTDPIVLDGVYLGEFHIELHIGGMAEPLGRDVYRVVALDPHPASSNDSVTHPHVSDEQLCEGDASAAIRAALHTGRICDFFVLVRSVLTTYNPSSPYVPLAEWEGRACYECGYVTSRDDLCWCCRCENEYCQDCASYCRCCDQTVCLACLTQCAGCQEWICQECMSSCSRCSKPLCRACCEQDNCPCMEPQHQTEDRNDSNTPSQAADVCQGAAGQAR